MPQSSRYKRGRISRLDALSIQVVRIQQSCPQEGQHLSSRQVLCQVQHASADVEICAQERYSAPYLDRTQPTRSSSIPWTLEVPRIPRTLNIRHQCQQLSRIVQYRQSQAFQLLRRQCPSCYLRYFLAENDDGNDWHFFDARSDVGGSNAPCTTKASLKGRAPRNL